MISHIKLRKIFADFWESKGHVEVPGIPLVPQNDPTTLFTGSGMQQLVPNLLGEPHPLGTRLYNIQRCVRAQDIDEVGDNRHDTFFEMMGNWSLGDYFKKDQLDWFFTFLTQKLGLDPTRLYVTIFKGDKFAPRDMDSEQIWRSQFLQVSKDFLHIGIDEITVNEDPEGGMKKSDRIFYYGAHKNWWSRAGIPENMPVGEIGGPDSEVFFDFDPLQERKIHEKSAYSASECHPNCECGRFLEIGNSVFMEYVKAEDGFFKPLPKTNVDFGGGLERMLAAANDDPDVFKTDVLWPIVESVQEHISKKYGFDEAQDRSFRMAKLLHIDREKPMKDMFKECVVATQNIYSPVENNHTLHVTNTILDEIDKYLNTFENGRKIIAKFVRQKSILNGQDVFDLYQSVGVASDEIVEMVKEQGGSVNMDGFEEAKQKHSALSRSGSEQKFKGGLADQSEQVVKYHTATHLLHQALCDVLGYSVQQEGSNITGERLRFDFRCDHKPTPEDIAKVSYIIQGKIQEALPVSFVIIPKAEAEKLGAKSFFKEKYPDMVKVYFVGQSIESAYSKEFCGGPHVVNTQEIGTIELYKSEKIGKDLYRVYGK